jgi:hypothetical protein
MAQSPRAFVAQQPVIDSGQIVSFGTELIELRPFPDSIYSVLINFEAAHDEALPTRISSGPQKTGGFQVTIHNFKLYQGGISTNTPIVVAIYSGKEVRLSLSIFTIGNVLKDCTKIVSYTFISQI